MLLTFHNGALFRVRQFAPASSDSYIIDFYKPSYDADSSLAVKPVLHCPFPSLETYLHYNDLSVHLFYINQHYQERVYTHDHSLVVLLDPQYIVQDRKSTRLNSSHVAISYAV